MNSAEDILNKLSFNGFNITANTFARSMPPLKIHIKDINDFHRLIKHWDKRTFPSGEEFGRLMECDGFNDVTIVDNDGVLLYQSDK